MQRKEEMKMSKKYYDEFTRLTLPKLAKAISEMTYLFENTEVPDKHYKKLLEQDVLELLSTDSSIQVTLLNAIYTALQSLEKESPKLFLKAMLCNDLGIKPQDITAREYFALDMTWEEFSDNKVKKYLSSDVLDRYQQHYDNGLPLESSETDMEHLN